MADQTTGTQGGTQTGDGTGQPPQQGGQQNAGIQFTPEQQAHIDGILSERLTRAQQKWEKEQTDKATRATAEADKTRMAEEKKFADLAEANRKEADTAKAEAATLAARLRTHDYRDAFRKHAVDVAKVKFASVQAELDAFALLDLSGVEMDKDGTVTGMEAALKALQASRPYLFAKPETAGANVNAADGRGTGAPADDAAYKAELKQRFHI